MGVCYSSIVKMAALGAPLRVSPLIKTARWSFLIAGFLYGSNRNATLLVEEAAFREEDAKKQAIIDAQRADEKKAANRGEMIYMAHQAGVVVPGNVNCKFDHFIVSYKYKECILLQF